MWLGTLGSAHMVKMAVALALSLLNRSMPRGPEQTHGLLLWVLERGTGSSPPPAMVPEEKCARFWAWMYLVALSTSPWMPEVWVRQEGSLGEQTL